MKRFLSMLATLVLLGQSVVTPLVYATDFVNENEGTVPVASVETEVADPVSDESDDNEVTTDVDNPSDDAEESAELEESADTEESVKAEDSDTLEESKITEDAETSEVAETEKVEETVTEETYAEDVEESSIEESVSYGKSFSSTLSQSWREISTNGLMVTAVDSLGAFPEGTEMVVTAIEEDEVFDLVNDAILANVTKVRAVDITFWHNGEAVEPTQPINVTISALNMTEPQTVVHIDDEENVEEMEADIKGKTADFLAESFSIYAFVETKKLTVNLYNGGEEPVVINVKSASELVESVDHASIVYDPGVTLNSGEVFRGWIAEKANYTTEDAKNGKTIADIRSSLASEFPLSENKTVNFYAMIFNQHTVTYYDENGAVLKTYDGLYQGENAPSYTVNQPYTPKEGENFEGWKDVATNIVYGNGSGLTLDKDYELKVYTKQGNWLVFDENGKGATYIAPKFIYGGDNTVAPADPERFGYTFEGWYTEKYEDNETPDESKEFAFGSKLEEKTTIYAKWTANKKADYTIIVWKQNVKGGDNYDFEEVITINGNVGSNINTVSAQGNGNNRYARINGVNKQYNGFHLKEFDQNVKIVPEGNAVLNVYYDRNEYTLTFQVPGNGNNKWNTVKTIKALYQQPIGDNFPIVGTNGTNYSASRWDPQSDTPYNQVLVYIDIMPAANVIFHQSTASHSTKNIHYYVEALPGQTPIRTYNGMGFVEYKSIGANYHHFTEAEDYIEIVGFTKGGTIYPPEAYGTTRNNRSYHKLSSVWDNENAEDVYCYYTRNHNPVVYMDGVYVNGDNNPVEGYSSRGQLHDVEGISYGADLSSYNKGGENYYEPTYTGFVFEGWYIDEACTQPYKFTKMPEASLTVYAKWIQSQYRVFLHPNVLTGDTSLDWGSETQATAFRISNGGTVSLPEGRRTSYEFVGWYTDPEFNNAFIDSTKLNDTTVTTSYDQTQSTELDKYGNPTEDTNKDATNNRFWITKKLDLYAKWRSKLDGANGIKLVYVDENGNTIGEDIKQYVADAEFVALSAPTIEGKQFKYWKVLDKDGGDTTDVTALPGEVFKVDVSWANIQPITCTDKEKENCKEYTVTLRAFYGPIEEEQNTKIEYCSNYDANDTYCVVKDLSQNTEHTVLGTGVLGEKGERTGYKFIGWNTEAKGSGTSYEVGAGVGVNEEEPLPNKLYAQWEVIQYEVTFVDEDGTTVLKEATKYDYGTPVTEIKKPENPTKAATAEYTYTFAGWTPEVVDVTANATYTATYSSTKNKYKVTFVDEDGTTVLKEATEYEYGTKAADVVAPEVKSYTGEDHKVYTFKEWTPAIVDVTADATYKATYEALGECEEHYNDNDKNGTCEIDKFTVTFVDEDGTTVLKEATEYEYGTKAADVVAPEVKSYTGEDHKVYTFKEWTPAIVDVTADATYKATYEALGECEEHYNDNDKNGTCEIDKFTVTFVDEDGTTVLKEATEYEYGTKAADVVAPEVKSYTGEDHKVYTFKEWTPAIVDVTADATYKATYEALGECEEHYNDNDKNGTCEIDKFTVTFVDEDGTIVLKEATEYEYGTKAADVVAPEVKSYTGEDHKVYTFKEWTPAIVDVTADATYKATYEALGECEEHYNDNDKNGTCEIDKFTVTFVDEDGITVLKEATEYEYGTKAADVVAPEVKSYTGEDHKVYTFKEWTPAIVDVTADATYKATYEALGECEEHYNDNDKNGTCEIDKFTVTFVDEDGTTVLKEATEYEYGTKAADVVAPEVKSYTGEDHKVYTFKEWTPAIVDVTADATYKATYEALGECEEHYNDNDKNGTCEIDKFTVTFVDEDGTTVLKEATEYEYGTKAADVVAPEVKSYTGEDHKVYTFKEWTPAIVDVTADATYKATYEALGECEEHYNDNDKNGTCEIDKFTVTFVDEDGITVLKEATEYEYGTKAADVVAPEVKSYTGEDHKVYTFKEWTPAIVAVTADATYKATYEALGECEEHYNDNDKNGTCEIDKFTVTFVDEDGTTVLKEATEYEYGTKAADVVAPEVKSYTGEDHKVYTFKEWTPAIVDVTADATYKATYEALGECEEHYNDNDKNGTCEIDKFTVTFVDEDGTTVLKEATEYEYGTKAADVVAPENPTKDATAEFTYEFDAWDTIPETLTEDVVVKATYKSTKNKYTITFVDEDGSEIQSGDVEYGETPTAPAPSKDPDDSCTAYVLSGWTPEIVPVVGKATYKVSYKCETVATYTITWMNENETLETDENVPYDTTPTYDGDDPTKTVEGYVYTWTGWNPTVAPVKGDTTYTAIYDVACAADYHNQSLETKTLEEGSVQTNSSADVGEASTADLVCVSNTQEGMACVEGNKPANSHFDSKTGTGTWNGTGYDVACPWSCDSGYTKDGESCKRNGGGGGGGGGSSSSSYRCENLPENAVANNTDKPNRNTDYSYSDDTSKVCTFQCKSGYTRDKDNKKCVKSENPGGGDGGEEEIELGGQVSDKCSVEGFKGSEEEKAAYLYACENDITTIRDINEARLKDFLTRAEMAKMVSVFATKELGMKPNTSKDCSNFANSISHYNQEMKDYMVMSCQLELMGIHTVNYEPIPDFMPSKRVSRAEFGTVLSRVLWGNKYEGTNSNYYINHLNALKENNIITNINPNITEYRAWVFLMLYRAVEAIKVLKSTNNVAIDQQVNEELQEEGKAETGLIVEYDSGSVVPDMATLTESGTLATGSVAEVGTGSAVEAQSGDTVPLTGDDISKEVSAETGSTAETETGSTSD